MRAAIFDGNVGRLDLVDDVQLDDPGPGEVRVRVGSCGICHSDLSSIDGTFPVPTPIILGHEAAGVVEALGDGIRSLAVGDHVVMTPNGACGSCYGCRRGEPGTCVNAQAMWAFAMPDGTQRLSRGGEPVFRGLGVAAFAEQLVTPEDGAVKIDSDIPLDVACLIGCGVQTGVGAVINTAGVEEGATVLVVGAGGVGLSVVQGARLAAASRIVVSDPVEARREAALAFGATDVLDPSDVAVSDAVRELTGGIGVDYAFEVVGASALVTTCIDACRNGGTTVMVGAPAIDDSLTIDAAVLFAVNEKKLLGCMLGSSDSHREIPRLLALWKTGRLDLEGLVTAHRPFDEINEALDALARHDGLRTVLSY